MRQLRLHRADRLNDDVFDVTENLLRVVAHLLDILQRKSQTALVTHLVLLAALVLDVVACRLIDGVVSEVHVEIAEVVLIWRPILASGQAAQPFFVEQNAQRVNSAQQNVDSQVKLQLVDQKWLV